MQRLRSIAGHDMARLTIGTAQSARHPVRTVRLHRKAARHGTARHLAPAYHTQAAPHAAPHTAQHTAPHTAPRKARQRRRPRHSDRALSLRLVRHWPQLGCVLSLACFRPLCGVDAVSRPLLLGPSFEPSRRTGTVRCLLSTYGTPVPAHVRGHLSCLHARPGVTRHGSSLALTCSGASAQLMMASRARPGTGPYMHRTGGSDASQPSTARTRSPVTDVQTTADACRRDTHGLAAAGTDRHEMVPPPATVDDRPLLAASDSRSAPAPPRLRPSGQGSAASLSPPPVASRVADAYPTRAVGGGRQHWPRPWVRVLEKRPACSRWDRLEVGPARGSPVSNRVKLRPRTVCSRAVTRFQRPEANGQTLANLCRATTDISTAAVRWPKTRGRRPCGHAWPEPRTARCQHQPLPGPSIPVARAEAPRRHGMVTTRYAGGSMAVEITPSPARNADLMLPLFWIPTPGLRSTEGFY
ncbi:hypothetical protein DCS_02008 [Drechmeria coniospora]|uniref:Uncharacterized protein n=1 Tax=Drechmeria coniospora TaxID=98403 RepID=A0A151GUW7_DRECN|nr:hypothetical protein DCS_02008 [Drechmeria coniospora]KYK60870.1 hypothetical protein DCS_02008 [Drechmeria coniospora]